MQRVAELWQQHQEAPFPPSCRGEEIEDIDLVMLDADTAGCVSTFLDRQGRLDPRRLAVLGLCYHDLGVAVARLKGEAREHFARLEQLARLVLFSVRDESKQARPRRRD